MCANVIWPSVVQANEGGFSSGGGARASHAVSKRQRVKAMAMAAIPTLRVYVQKKAFYTYRTVYVTFTGPRAPLHAI